MLQITVVLRFSLNCPVPLSRASPVMTASQTTSASYEVGYRNPPRHTQFQKGQSGNPGGRPRRLPAERLEELALYEAYRTTIVMEDGHAIPMPAIQAVLRRQLESAASGNVRAQRDILAMIRDIERIRSIAAMVDDDGDDNDVDETADAIDNDGNDADETAETAGADRDDAGSADDDAPARQQVDAIDTHGERRQAGRGVLHPPLKGEGRTAEGSPGWGEGRATDDSDAEFAGPLSPPPGPLTRADPRSSRGQALPPPGGGEKAWEPAVPRVSAAELSDRNPQQPISIGGREPTLPTPTPKRQGVRPRRNGAERNLLSPPPLAGEGQGGGQFHDTDSRQEPPPQPSPASGGGSYLTGAKPARP